MTISIHQKEYISFLSELKKRIQISQIKAVTKVNVELISMYREIGKMIVERQRTSNRWDDILKQLSEDLKREFPKSKWFSRRNLFYMKSFYVAYSNVEFVQQAVAQISRSHNLFLLSKCSSNEERFWYAQEVIKNGRSRNTLLKQIDSNLYKRQWKAVTNFKNTLPDYQSELVQHTLKDPYNFDFLTISDKAHEKNIENNLINHITKFLLELWKGFSFVGQQYQLPIWDKDYYIDLLFYHLELRCFVVIDLKTKKFKPEYAGKMNFYLNAVNDIMKHETDNPSIGIILCKDDKGKISEIEYALENINQPIGVSDFKVSDALPEEYKSSLPTIEELEYELEKIETLKNWKDSE